MKTRLRREAETRGRPAFRSAILAALMVVFASAFPPLLRPAAAQAAPPEPPSGVDVDEGPFRADEFVVGAAYAPVTVIEYLSVTCTHCAAFEHDTWPQVRSRFIDTGRVRFVLREMPTAPVAVSAAGFLMARCRGEADYWSTVEHLLQEQGRILAADNVDQAIRLEAQISGLSEVQARLCLSDPTSIDAVNARRQAGLALGVDSTPFFLVDGTPLRPGIRLAGSLYAGGELSFGQFAAAVARAERSQGRPGLPAVSSPATPPVIAPHSPPGA